jgi:ABC-type bacteriocin/lantibiotic exporter with double-glycine peptidase domain
VKAYLPREQTLSYTCGPVCLANALALYGISTSQEECQGACGTGRNGTSERDLSKGIRKMGFHPIEKVEISDDRERWNKLYKWVEDQTNQGRFVICSINGHGAMGHFVLLMRVHGTKVLVWNPSVNYPYLIKKSNLFKAWWNVNKPELNISPEEYPSCVSLISLSPRSKLAKRAVQVRYNTMWPTLEQLPTEK